MQPEQTVEEMANEVLMRQAEAEAERGTHRGSDVGRRGDRGRQATRRSQGRPHAEEGVEEWQAGMARECAEDIGGRLGEVPEHPTHG